jgi:dTDP-4-amino-4,6-dideoxygalactose transaminase
VSTDVTASEKLRRKRGVICEKPVVETLHRLLSFAKCPDSDCAYVHALSIPLYPSLREEEIEHVTKTLKIVSKKCPP